nr:MFS transporter [Gordonia sp. NB41Y]
MTRFQCIAIGVCVLLNVLDGFDVLAMAFTSSSVSAEWDLSGTVLGLLLSAGLVGMAIGSLVLAPLADSIGRKWLILACLAVSSATMLLSAAAQSAGQLGLLRVLTGVGIGGILANSNVISGELASRRWRGLAVSLNSTGYAIGATIGGLAAVLLVDTYGWRSVFLLGGVCTAALIPIAVCALPESVAYLLVRQPAGALARINAVARRIGHPPLEGLPPVSAASSATMVARVRELVDPVNRRTTLLVWTAFFLTMFGFYFVTSWTPKLLVEAGMSVNQGLTGGMILNLGGVLGTSLLGLLSARFRLVRVLAGYLVVSAVLLVVFVPATAVFTAAMVIGFAIGVGVNGCVAGLYATTTSAYDTSIRATVMGWGIGIGRIGAIVSPLAAGALLDADWSPGSLFAMVAAFFVAAGATVVFIAPTRRVEITTVGPPAGVAAD